MKKRALYLFLPLITLILEILPYGAVCNFALTDSTRLEYMRKLYSYFDLTPFGYANFAPFLTALTTCIIVALLVGYCITGKQTLAVTARNTLIACSVISLGPLAFGIKYFSAVGILISLSLISETFVMLFAVKSSKTHK